MDNLYHNDVYEGAEPYIFVSYSHRDAEQAEKIISRLQKENYRVWFDRGIEVGTEWPKVVAGHVLGAACMVCIVTPNWQNSKNCRREFNLADEENMKIINIIMSKFKLTPDLRMQMNLYQKIFKYRMQEEEFYTGLFKSSVLKECRGGDDCAQSGESARDDEEAGNERLDFDGGYYVGQTRDGKMNGRGTFYWASGSRYEGDFIDDNRTGSGVYYYADGRTEKGQFLNGKFLG